MQEVTAYNSCVKLHKLMTPLPYWNTQYRRGGLAVKRIPSEIRAFWTFQEELTIEDGLILKGTRIVVPSTKQSEILKLIHEGHLGLTKCKLGAKETVYWPGLNDQLEKLVLNCQLCLKYSQSKCKLTPDMSLGQEIPTFPWTKLAINIFNSRVIPTCYW